MNTTDLLLRGSVVKEFIALPLPLTASLLAYKYSPLDRQEAGILIDAFEAAGLIDRKGYLQHDPRERKAQVRSVSFRALPNKFPANDSLVEHRSYFFDILCFAYSQHQGSARHVEDALIWLELMNSVMHKNVLLTSKELLVSQTKEFATTHRKRAKAKDQLFVTFIGQSKKEHANLRDHLALGFGDWAVVLYSPSVEYGLETSLDVCKYHTRLKYCKNSLFDFNDLEYIRKSL